MKMFKVAIGATMLVLANNAPATVLLSNLAEPIRATTLVEEKLWAAQSFVNDGQAHLLETIRTILGNANGAPDIVAEFRQGTVTGALLTSFTAPSLAGGQSVKTLLPLSDVVLDPNETYWLILGVRGQGSFGWSYAQGNGYVGTGAFGAYAYSDDQGASWGTFGSDNPYFLEINVAGIPEPACWAMMIAGFGMAGTALRRRRTSVVWS